MLETQFPRLYKQKQKQQQQQQNKTKQKQMAYTLIADSVCFKTFKNFLKPMLLSIASLLIVV